MNANVLRVLLGAMVLVVLAGCVATPPRSRYYDDERYYERRAAYDCSRCGVIREVERVYVSDNSTSGGGAVIGAIIGGLLGNTIGHGDGRRAATVGGAVAGGVIGNEIERGQSRGYGREAWQFTVHLDNGRWARVTQWDHRDLRPGDRVVIRRDDTLIRLR